MRLAFASLLVAVTATTVAHADPITLRMSTIAPQGSGWAREFDNWARDVEAGTHGAVHIKMYYSAIAGDEFTALDRIKRDQLDGAIGSESCVRLGPTLRVMRIFGLFQNRDESSYVLGRIASKVDAEFLRAGFIHLGEAALGPEMLFTRRPVRDMNDLRKTTFWIWNADEAMALQAQALGIHVVATPLDGGARAYDDKRVDGIVAMPSAALAFQWSAQASYLENLEISYRNGCMFFASRAFDPLPIEAQRYIRSATAKLRQRLTDQNRRQDDALVGGLFARQGLQTVPVSEHFRMEFFAQAREMRDHVAEKLVPPKLLEEVLSWLADYRAEHPLR